MKKNVVSKLVEKIGLSTAIKSTNSSCAFFLYQPKQPKALARVIKK
jgi:cyclic lactone autoinducer peptide